MDDHVAVQMVGQVELLAAAWMGTHLGPAFPVDQVDVILLGEVRVRGQRSSWETQLRGEALVFPPESC